VGRLISKERWCRRQAKSEVAMRASEGKRKGGSIRLNFDNFPELHYENAYYWFWGQ
jgi:hypothetical protein